MKDIISLNKYLWDKLAQNGVQHSVPFLDMTLPKAENFVYRHDFIPNVTGLNVLCLAAGGGQDSVAFGLLGAKVTVLELSEIQLLRDKEAAEHHKLSPTLVQGDMNDLSMFESNTFDIVWQPYSINYSPIIKSVFDEVTRVIKSGGMYYLAFANPFAQALDSDSWNGSGYSLQGQYIDREDVTRFIPYWQVDKPDGTIERMESPHQFRHTLSSVLNGLTSRGFLLKHLSEWKRGDIEPEQGSWAHFTQASPPWFDSYWIKLK